MSDVANYVSADAATLVRLGAASWLNPPTVLGCANLPAVRQMIEWIDGPDGDAVCILVLSEADYRRFNVYPGSTELESEVLEAMAATGPDGAMVAANVLAPSGRGVPFPAEVKRLRWLPVSFTMRPSEEFADLAERVLKGGYSGMAQSEGINPLIMHDTIRDKLHILVPADISLLDESDRERATDLLRRFARCLGGDPLNYPLPAIVPLAGSIGVNGAGAVFGQVLAFLYNPNGPQPGRLAGSSLVELEQFVARLEASGDAAAAL